MARRGVLPKLTGEEKFETLFSAAVLGDLAGDATGKPISSAAKFDAERLYKMLLCAMGDESPKVREAGIATAMYLEPAFVQPKLFRYLDTDGDGESDADRADRTAASMAKLMGGMAKKAGDAAMATDAANRIAALLTCPSADVQLACADGIAQAVETLPESQAVELLKHYLGTIGETPAKIGAFGVAGAVKGLTSRSLVKNGVLDALEEAAGNKKDPKLREGACATYECLSVVLNNVFEPYSLRVLKIVIAKIGDKTAEVRAAAEQALVAIVGTISAHGLRAALPLIADQLKSSNVNWQAKVACLNAIAGKVKVAPKQVARVVHVLVPAIVDTLTDTKPEVQTAAQKALTTLGMELIQSPEMKAMVPPLIDAIISPGDKTTPCIEQLMDVTFINAIDRPCLAIMVPVLARGLKERRLEFKRRASMVVGNMCGLVIDGRELVPYVPALLPELVACVRDSNPEMRQYGAVALAALLKGMASAHLSSRFDLLLADLDRLQKDMVSDKEDVRKAAEGGLNELIEIATKAATKTHHTEEEVQADLARMKLEDEKRAKEAADAEAVAKRKEEMIAREETEHEPVPGKGFCEKVCRGCAQCKLHLEELAEVQAKAKKEDEKLAKAEAAKKAEEDKKKAFEKFQAQQKAALLKQQRAKKKK